MGTNSTQAGGSPGDTNTREPSRKRVYLKWNQPRVGVWLMPDNVSSGELENFIHKLIPEEDAIWPRAKQYIDDIPAEDRKFRDRKEFRAKIHAWLATCESPRQMGAAIGTRDLNSEAQIAKDFYEWLRQLFTETV